MEQVMRDTRKWAKKEEHDFLKTVMAFGFEYSRKEKRYVWDKFKQLARLETKTDDMLNEYLMGFIAMCKKAVGKKLTEDEGEVFINNILISFYTVVLFICLELLLANVEVISEENAHKVLDRIEYLNKIREDIITNKKLEERLLLCDTAQDLPSWWIPGKHDKDLLLGVAKHGLARMEYYILNDPELSYYDILKRHLRGESLIDKKAMEEFEKRLGKTDKKTENVKKEETKEEESKEKQEESKEKPEEAKTDEAESQEESEKDKTEAKKKKKKEKEEKKPEEEFKETRSRRKSTKDSTEATKLAIEASKMAKAEAAKSKKQEKEKEEKKSVKEETSKSDKSEKEDTKSKDEKEVKEEKKGKGKRVSIEECEDQNKEEKEEKEEKKEEEEKPKAEKIPTEERNCQDKPKKKISVSIQPPQISMQQMEQMAKGGLIYDMDVMNELMAQTYAAAIKWPKGKILEIRLSHVVKCIETGTWPVPDDYALGDHLTEEESEAVSYDRETATPALSESSDHSFDDGNVLTQGSTRSRRGRKPLDESSEKSKIRSLLQQPTLAESGSKEDVR